MNIVPDPMLTALLVAPFLVLVFGMQAVLYKPMLAYLDARAAATVGARKEAEQLQAQSGSRLGEWEAALARAQAEVTDFRAGRRAVAQAEYQRIVNAARTEAEAHLAGALETLRGEVAVARTGLEASARTLAGDVAEGVLGRPLSQVEA